MAFAAVPAQQQPRPGVSDRPAALAADDQKWRPTCGKSTTRRRQKRPKSRRKPGKFQTAVWDTGWPTETLIGHQRAGGLGEGEVSPNPLLTAW